MPAAFNHIHSSHAAYKIQLTLEVNGKSVPVVEATVEFAINQIPIARVVVPSGATFDSQGKAVEPQILKPEDLIGRKPAQLRLQGKGKPHPTGSSATPKMGIDYDDFIFHGYVLSSSAAFSTTGVSTTVVLAHWMYDLDLASFACGDFDRNVPDDWFSFTPDMLARSDKSNPVWKGQGQGQIVAFEEYLDNDWWEEIIKPAAKYKASFPLRRFQNQPENNNQAAIAAIDGLVSKGCMKLNAAASSSLRAASYAQQSINELVGLTIFKGEGGSTAFEKFVSLLSHFGAVLAPRVDECLVMPYNPVGKVDVFLTDAECDFAGGSANPANIPGGAIMYSAPYYASLVNLDSSIVENNWTGVFVPSFSADFDGGPFIVFPTPGYLQGIRRSLIDNSAFKTKVGIVPVTSPSQKPASAKQAPVPDQFANEVAKSMYYSKVFASKTQEVLCGFRLDVAPGDCIKISKEADSATGRNVSGLAQEWAKRGIVEAVTHIFSAPGNRINTTYRLRHLMERQDMDLFGISDEGQSAALFENKPPNASSPLKQMPPLL